MYPFLEGIILGFTLAIMLGPAVFSLLQTSIHRGFKRGIFLAVGIFLSDITLVALCFLGALQLIDDSKANNVFFGIIGGIILVLFGGYTFWHKYKMYEDNNQEEIKQPNLITYILKGFFLNFTNPFIWIFWIGVMGLVKANYSPDNDKIIEFFSGTLLTVFTTDILKCYIANSIKQRLNSKVLILLNHIVGILLILFGLALIIRVLIAF